MWGIIPAAGIGSRIQPLAFSKELLPVGSRPDAEAERPRAVSEYLVVTDDTGSVREVQVKPSEPKSDWIWGAFKLNGRILTDLHELWVTRSRKDEYVGTLVNAWLARGGRAQGVRAGEAYVDVGTLHGYRHAIQLLASRAGRTPTNAGIH